MQVALEPHSPADLNDRATRSPNQEDITQLVANAIGGSERAWCELYRRYNSLISSTAQSFRLTEVNREDVNQNVWLQLVLHIKDLREPRALSGWIVTTTRNEALKIIGRSRRCEPADPLSDARLHQVDETQPDENLNRAEQRRAVHALIGELRPEHQELFRLLLADPHLSYAEIGRRLGIPVGSIGPTRARCLTRLRACSALNALSPATMAA
jgi:RNA polymerase sigma factor (sigma-70 family)